MCSARMPFANLSPVIMVPSWVEEISMSTLHNLHPPAIKSGFRKGNKKPPLFSRAAHSHRVLTHHLHKNPSPLWYSKYMQLQLMHNHRSRKAHFPPERCWTQLHCLMILSGQSKTTAHQTDIHWGSGSTGHYCALGTVLFAFLWL